MNASRYRTIVVSALLLAGVGCVAQSPPFQRFDIETKLIEHSVDASAIIRSSRRPTERFLLGARQKLFVSANAMRVDTTIAEPPGEGERRQDVKRRRVHWLYDFGRGEIWRADEGEPFRRKPLVQYDHELESRRRVGLLEYVDDFVRIESVRRLQHASFYRGDGQVALEGPGADRLIRARVAVNPRHLWQLTVEDRELSRFPQRWIAERIVLRICETTTEEAYYVARAVRGLPLRFRLRALGSEENYIEERHTVLSADNVDLPDGFFEVPHADAERERGLYDAVKSWDVFFALLDDVDPADEERRWLGILLELERREGNQLPATVEDVWRKANPDVRLELMRLALRKFPVWARTRLRAAIAGSSAALAHAAANAMIFEEEDGAADAVYEVLRRRREYVDTVDPGLIVDWALVNLRVLSGLSYEELVLEVCPFWMADPERREFPDPYLSTARELDFWLRRRESKKADDR
jgi:hypothetical protein